MKYIKFFLCVSWLTLSVHVSGKMMQTLPAALNKAGIRISFGHRAPKTTVHSVRISPGSVDMKVSEPVGSGMEKNDKAGSKSVLHTGKGDIDVLTVEVTWPAPTAAPLKLASHKDQYTVNNDAMWGYLMENGSEGQAARLQDDTWRQPDTPKLTIQLANDGTKGFSIAVEQLRPAQYRRSLV